jgi:hypothetical protein
MIFLNCYNLFKHTCNARCQGCCSCPFAEAYHNETPVKDVTRWDIVRYAFVCWYELWNFKRMLKTKEGKEASEELAKLYDELFKTKKDSI